MTIVDKPKTLATELLQKFLTENKINLSVDPQFVSRDDGTFSVVVKLSVDYIKEETICSKTDEKQMS